LIHGLSYFDAGVDGLGLGVDGALFDFGDGVGLLGVPPVPQSQPYAATVMKAINVNSVCNLVICGPFV